MRNGSKIWSFFIRCAYRWIREAHYFQINITFRQGSSSATLPSLFFLVLSSGNTPCVCLSWNPIFRSLLQWLKPETRASHKGKLHKARPGTPKIRETSLFQISPPVAKTRNPRKVIKESWTKQDQVPQKSEKPPPWAVVRSLLTCKHLQTQQQKQREQTVQGSGKKCKKMKCSGSLRSNSKVMPRPEMSSPEDHKKRTSMASSNTDGSSRSMKAPLSELNGAVSSTSSSLSASSNSSFGGSFKGMPLRRLSGCYECRMVVDPVLGITRDPSLRTTICSCPDCGEIFMKAEILELHQAVRHAGEYPLPGFSQWSVFFF